MRRDDDGDAAAEDAVGAAIGEGGRDDDELLGDGGDDEVDVVGGDNLGEDVEEVVVARCGNLGEAGARRVDDGHVGADHLEAARLELEVEAPAGGAADAGEENADHQPITPSKARTRTGSKASALAIFACCPRKAAMPATRSEPM